MLLCNLHAVSDGLVRLVLLVYQSARRPTGLRPSLGAAPERSTALLVLLLLQDSLQPLPLRLVLPRRPSIALRWELIRGASLTSQPKMHLHGMEVQGMFWARPAAEHMQCGATDNLHMCTTTPRCRAQLPSTILDIWA